MILRLVSGSTVIDFDWNNRSNPYGLTTKDGWTPQIAARSSDQIDGRMYMPVTESIQVTIFGDNASNALSRLNVLARLLDQADRFADGDLTVTAVTIQYMPNGGKLVYEDIVLGRAVGDKTSGVKLSPTFNSSLNGYTIDVTMVIVRGGLWLGETDTASSSATSAGTVWSVTLPDHHTPSPCKVVWTMPTPSATGSPALPSHMLITSPTAADIQVMEAELFNGAASWGSTAVTNARGGAVLDFNPAAANTDYSTGAITGFPSGIQTEGQWLIIAHALEVTADATLIFVVTTDGGPSVLATPAKVFQHWGGGIPVGSEAEPNVIGLLYVSGVSPIASMTLTGRVADAANGYTIDYFVFLRLSALSNVANMNFAYFDYGNGNTVEEILDHRITTHLTPIAQTGRVSGVARGPTAMLGGSQIIMQSGTNLSGVLMAGSTRIGSAGFAGTYRVADSASAVYSSTFTVTRRRGYLVPE